MQLDEDSMKTVVRANTNLEPDITTEPKAKGLLCLSCKAKGRAKDSKQVRHHQLQSQRPNPSERQSQRSQRNLLHHNLPVLGRKAGKGKAMAKGKTNTKAKKEVGKVPKVAARTRQLERAKVQSKWSCSMVHAEETLY